MKNNSKKVKKHDKKIANSEEELLELDFSKIQQAVIEEEKQVDESKKRKIKRSKSEDPQRLYFHAGTCEAITKYQQEKTNQGREKIYVQDILPAFQKLVENLINIHKFVGLHDSYDDLKNDCVNFLFETILKFDASRGTNAFSYFNVVAKNWLIIKTKQKSHNSKKNVSLDDSDTITLIEQLSEVQSDGTLQDTYLDKKMMSNYIVKNMYEIRNFAKTENELLCINSIITIFESIENLDMLNKKAVLLYIREISGLTPKQLTTALQSLKKYYRKAKNDESNFFMSL